MKLILLDLPLVDISKFTGEQKCGYFTHPIFCCTLHASSSKGCTNRNNNCTWMHYFLDRVFRCHKIIGLRMKGFSKNFLPASSQRPGVRAARRAERGFEVVRSSAKSSSNSPARSSTCPTTTVQVDYCNATIWPTFCLTRRSLFKVLPLPAEPLCYKF